MTRKHIAFGIIVALIVASNTFFCGCVDEPAPKGKGNTTPITLADDSGATHEGVSSVVSASNQFAFDLYLELREDEEGNIFFSPYSISTALAMTYEGARGQTAEEMQSVLHFPEDNDTRRYSYARLHNQLNKEDKDYTLQTANALWAHEDYQFLDEYFDIIERYYVGNTTNLDFVEQPEESRETINNWVEERTNDKIKDLIPQGFINWLTRLILTNAIYFKGNWVTQFDPEDTQEQDFKVSPEKTVKTPMMSITGESFNYTATEDLQILEMPYEGNDLSMLILLPKGDDLESVEASISAEKISEWRDDLNEQEIDIYIPKFKFETKYFLKKELQEMGMPTAFTDSADFSGMDDTRNLHIGFVIHQGFVEVNEEGTEAAAATGVGMELTCAPPSFRADHPFIFLIQHKESGNILFLGSVMDPTE